jgi:hypothetical protein
MRDVFRIVELTRLAPGKGENARMPLAVELRECLRDHQNALLLTGVDHSLERLYALCAELHWFVRLAASLARLDESR